MKKIILLAVVALALAGGLFVQFSLKDQARAETAPSQGVAIRCASWAEFKKCYLDPTVPCCSKPKELEQLSLAQ